MFDKIEKARSLLREALRELDPEVLEPASAGELTETFADIEHMGAAGKALAARRFACSGAWKLEGHRSPANWMALKTGTTVGNAISVLETAERLGELPKTDEALRSGRLSEVQAVTIASAAAAHPAAEAELLEAAGREGVAVLKDRCAKLKASAAADEVARHEAIRKTRYLRHWTDYEGAFRLEGKFTPEAGAVVLAALTPEKEKMFKQARQKGRPRAGC